MTELTDLSETDADNTSVTTANIAEGCPPSGINNAIRNTLGLIRRAFKSSIFRLRDSTDQTKLLAFDLSGLTTATTRTLTVPDASGTLPVLGLAQTWTAAQTFPTGTSVRDAAAAILNLNIGGSDRAFFSYTEATQVARIDSDATLVLAPNNAEAARLTPNGKLLVGTTTESSAKALFVSDNTSVRAETTLSGAIVYDTNYNVASGTATFLQCRYNGSAVGSISSTGATTAYNTTSDYRAKSDARLMSDLGEEFSTRIDALKPREWNWLTPSGEVGRGFIAHEFANVYPGSVTGEKDAVNEDGTPKLQSMQASTSEVMADIIAELQSLRRRVAGLEGN